MLVSRDERDREYERASRERNVPDYIGTCDKCDGPNDRANESNYCTPCSAAFQARTLRNPECQPVGTPSDVEDLLSQRRALVDDLRSCGSDRLTRATIEAQIKMIDLKLAEERNRKVQP